MKSFKSFIAEEREEVLNEGGGFGHLNAPHHLNLSLATLKDIIKNAYEGTLESVAEKTDGQNLMISWKGGKLIASRNKGNQKNFGEMALDRKGLEDKFAGRGELSNAFNNAFADLEKALSQLSKDKLNELFAEGRKWASLEIMTPKNENIIHYGVTEIRFHGIMEMGADGEPISQLNQSAGRYIAKLLKEINANIQDTYEIKGLSKIQLDRVKNAEALIKKSNSDLSTVFKKYGLTDNNTIHDYQRQYLIKEYLKGSVNKEAEDALIHRWVMQDKSLSITAIKKMDEANKDVITKLDKEVGKVFTKAMQPIDRVFLEVGTNVIANIKTFMSVNPDKAVRKIRDRMQDTIGKISKSDNQKLKDEMKRQIDRINSIGGESTIMPSEGITFFYQGELLKLTGSFATANQLINLVWRM